MYSDPLEPTFKPHSILMSPCNDRRRMSEFCKSVQAIGSSLMDPRISCLSRSWHVFSSVDCGAVGSYQRMPLEAAQLCGLCRRNSRNRNLNNPFVMPACLRSPVLKEASSNLAPGGAVVLLLCISDAICRCMHVGLGLSVCRLQSG